MSIALTAVCGIGQIVRTIGTIPAVMSFFCKAGLAANGLAVVCKWSFRRWKGGPFADRIADNSLLLSAAILATLVASEMALRLFFHDATTTPDNASYFAHKWNVAPVTVNASGFRGPEFQVPKPPGVYRIAVIGDSFTYGQGIAEEDRLAGVLERRLNNRVGKFEVLIFGQPGSQSDQHVS